MHNNTEAQHAKFVKLTTQPVGRLVTSLAVPAMVSMLVMGFYNIVDTFFVGQINTQSVAALGIVFSYMSIVQSIAFFFGQGAGNYISRRLGHEDTHNASIMASVGLVTTWLTGAAIAIVGLLFMEPVLRFFGSTATIMPYACDYFRYILIGTPFIMGTFTLNNQMQLPNYCFYAGDDKLSTDFKLTGIAEQEETGHISFLISKEEALAIRDVERNKVTLPATYYDLQGRLLSTPQKPGLYITRGKKLLLK